jgi:plasmid stabilization system protein ParE
LAKIRWTDEAVNWLENIYDYLFEPNPSVAQKTVQGIYIKVQLLKDFPRIGHIYERISGPEIWVLL